MLIRFLRRNSLLIAFSGLCLLVVGLALLELDKQHYQDAKSALIRNNIYYYVTQEAGTSLDEIWELALLHLRKPEIDRARSHDELAAAIDKVLAGDNFVYRIAVREQENGAPPDAAPADAPPDADPGITVIDRSADKFARQNRFSNALFLDGFSGLIDKPIEDGGRMYGRLVVNYTTPLGYQAIEELTRRYRWYAIFLTALLALLAWAIAHSLLIPLRNVSGALESSSPDHTPFIPRPRARLETFYNRMALDAVVARLQGQLRDQIARNPQATGWEIVRFAATAFADQTGLPLVACAEFAAEGPGRLRPTGATVCAGIGADLAQGESWTALLESALPADGRDETPFAWLDRSPPLVCSARLLTDPQRAGVRYLFLLAAAPDSPAFPPDVLHPMAARLAALAEGALQTLGLRNRLLVQERGRASISLSRNLGHDLTNIIATSKLELLTLERILRNGEAPPDDRRRAILIDSLGGLLRSVRFMQETVNLYRAYAYLQQPVLETTDGNALVRETLELFEVSTSNRVALHADLAGDAPRCAIDPRLVKLALFNLFTNALEAIRRQAEDAEGWIRVATRRAADGGLEIVVEDSGVGIRTPAGERASPHEIEKIFELGYTTGHGADSSGEGLGLNWVRQIVEELHGGGIRAENTPAAGARFIIHFPPLKAGPAAAQSR